MKSSSPGSQDNTVDPQSFGVEPFIGLRRVGLLVIGMRIEK